MSWLLQKYHTSIRDTPRDQIYYGNIMFSGWKGQL